MQTIKIYLAESGSIANLQKNFPLYQGQYQSKLLNILVPTSILAPNFTTISGNSGNVIDEYVAGTAVKIGMRTVERNGKYQVSQNYYLRFLKTLTYQGVEYALYERKLPQEFTLYAGQGVNAPSLIINVINVEVNYTYVIDSTVTALTEGIYYTYNSLTEEYTQVELPEDYEVGETYYQKVFTPTTLSIITSQTCSLEVMPSSSLDNDGEIEPSELELISTQINGINSVLLTKQDKTDNNLATTNKTVVGAINEVNTIIANIEYNEDYIGSTSGTTIPFNLDGTVASAMVTVLNTFVTSKKGASYVYKGGEVVIYEQIIAGETNKICRFVYSKSSQSWTGYILPSVEVADNGSLGLVKGTYVVGATANTIVDIQSGEIKNIYIKDNGNYVNIDTIPTTYMTKSAGATKLYVKEYALPRQFNDTYFVGQTDFETTPPNPTITVSGTSTSIGYTQVMQNELELTTSFELSRKNGYNNTFNINVNLAGTYQFRLKTEYKKVADLSWTTLNTELSEEITYISSSSIKQVKFNGIMSSLNNNVITLDIGDSIRQTLEILTETSDEITATLYSGTSYVSTFNLTVQDATLVIDKLSDKFEGSQHIVVEPNSDDTKILVELDNETSEVIEKLTYDDTYEELDVNGMKVADNGDVTVARDLIVEDEIIIDSSDKIVDANGDKVIDANNQDATTQTLTKLKVGGVNYNIPSGSGSGTVTSITAGTGLDGGTITTSGTISLNTETQASLGKADSAVQPSDLGTSASKNTGTSAGNVVEVGNDGKIPSSVIPASAITDTFVVNSQSAMLALTVQVGDVCVRTDLHKTFILKTEPASTLSNWQELLTPTDAVQSVNGQTGAVSLTANDVNALPNSTIYVSSINGESGTITNVVKTSDIGNTVQGKLTAGTGISISGNTISASKQFAPDITHYIDISWNTSSGSQTYTAPDDGWICVIGDSGWNTNTDIYLAIVSNNVEVFKVGANYFNGTYICMPVRKNNTVRFSKGANMYNLNLARFYYV